MQALLREKADIAILDARRFDEYQTMSIPTGVSVPGAELVLGARAVAPDPDTTIIVNCAGRTRSLIGAQSLINAGLPNRIFALRNGSGSRVEYGSADHHLLISRAIRARLGQNAGLQAVLLATAGKDLVHETGTEESPTTSLPAVVFCRILTTIRSELLAGVLPDQE